MAYEPFHLKQSRMPTEATISVLKQGVMGSIAWRSSCFKDVQFITLHSDWDALKNGIKPATHAGGSPS